ncbi:MAG TPA: PIN domain-containing protein [bacterium]|nr:PIN domain-containing protein [bacterium]
MAANPAAGSTGITGPKRLSRHLGAGDALIAATAAEHNMTLASGNAKYFKAIKGLDLKIFKP